MPLLHLSFLKTLRAFLAIAMVLFAQVLVLVARPFSPVAAQPSVTWPPISLVRIANNYTFNAPVFLNHAGDGSGRLFAVEQAGQIRIIKNSSVLATPFLDIADRVLKSGEQGLLSVAFPPDYAFKGYFYVYYTRKDGNNQVSRFHITSNPDVADPNSEEQILFLAHPVETNHNGGQLAFGPDNYLYIGTGDGGSSGDPHGNGQNKNTLLGKVLRIDVEMGRGSPPSGSVLLYMPLMNRNSDEAGVPPVPKYRIPPGNPFIGMPNHKEEIWALGLRNPWRFSFDRQSGDLYIADVGQDRMEEVDFHLATSQSGQNYGWNILEGSLCFNPSSGCVPPLNYSAPVDTYNHGSNESIGCSISGGYIYRGSAYPALQGIYFYGDYCTGRIWGLQKDGSAWTSHEFTKLTINISSFGEDQNGEIYVLDINGGMYHLVTP